LGDIAEKITKGTTPTTYGKAFVSKGINFFKVETIASDGSFLPEKIVHIDQETHDKLLRRSQIEYGDILLTMAGAIGRVARVEDQSLVPANTNQAICLIRIKDEKWSPAFIKYFLMSSFGQAQLKEGTVQTAQPNISLAQISSIKVPNISRGTQDQISEILSKFDKKIELTRKMNKTLEEMGQALFKHYFIDNPDAKDWEKKPLDEIADFLNGLASQKYPEKKNAETLPVIKIREMSGSVDEGSDRVSVEFPKEYIIENGDFLFAWSGTLMTKMWTGGRGALNQHIFKVTSNLYPKWFYYHWTNHYLQQFSAIAKSKAVTMGHIKRSHLTEALVSVPPNSFIEEVGHTFEPILNEQTQNSIEISVLVQVRDSILPKLINGDIEV